MSCEVTLQPIHRLKLDSAIIVSDILVVPKAMGMEVTMEEKKGPVLPKPITIENYKEMLKIPDYEKQLGHVYDAIYLTR